MIDRREDGGYVTPKEVTGQDPVLSAACATTRRSRTGSRCGSSADNLRKGAALNAVQIAEELIKGYI